MAYGVAPEGAEQAVAIAAITLREGHELIVREITRAMRLLPVGERPEIVHVVAAIPVTTWYRPVTGPLREAGVPEPGDGVQAWCLDADTDSYRPLTDAEHRRFVGAGEAA